MKCKKVDAVKCDVLIFLASKLWENWAYWECKFESAQRCVMIVTLEVYPIHSQCTLSLPPNNIRKR